MKTKITTISFILLFALCTISNKSIAQSDSANFNVLKQLWEQEEEDRVSRSGGGTEEEFSKFQRWKSFWSPRIGATGNYSPMIQATRDYYDNYFAAERSASSAATAACSNTSSNWQLLGPSGYPTSQISLSNGIGKMECVRVHPTNSNIIYAGSTRGGVWKSTDGGNSWVNLNTDNLPVLSISDIAINPLNPNTIYIATGINAGGVGGSDYTNSIGIYKTLDGGKTWNKTGMSASSSTITTCNSVNGKYIWDLGMGNQNTHISRLIIHPTDTNTVIAAVNHFVFWYCNDRPTWGGIYKSTDGGTNWACKQDGFMQDLEFKPGTNPSIVYASGKDVYKSTDKGETWNKLTVCDASSHCMNVYVGNCASQPWADAPGKKVLIAVTPAAPDNLYILALKDRDMTINSDDGLWVSTDAGSSFVKKNGGGLNNSDCFNGLNINAWHFTLAVSPTNQNVIYTGGCGFAKSSDGGNSFSITSCYTTNGIHADVNDIVVVPGSATTIYTAHDGGISINTNEGNSGNWQYRSNGLQVAQYHDFGISGSDPVRVIGGAQDATTHLFDGSSWRQTYCYGDGGVSAIDYTDPNIMYAEVNGGMIRTTTGGNSCSWTSINPPNAGSGAGIVVPFLIHPTNPQILYAGLQEVAKSNNRGTNWIAPPLSDFRNPLNPTYANLQSITTFAVAPSNDSYIYVVFPGTWSGSTMSKMLYRTTNANNATPTWTELTLPDNTISVPITSIAIDPTNPNKVWVAYSGYWGLNQNNHKVYKSTDGGSTWTDYSGLPWANGLPFMPANSIVLDPTSTNEAVYVGMDVGVYYRDNTMAVGEWQPFLTNLPNTIMNELEINPTTRKIYGSCYGRGIWVSDMAVDFDATSYTASTNTTWTPTSNPFLRSRTSINKVYIQNELKITASDLKIQNMTFEIAENASVTIKNGAKLTLLNTTLQETAICGKAWTLNIETGGTLDIQNGSHVHMSPGSYVFDNGEIKIQNGGKLEIHEYSVNQVKNGGKLNLEDGGLIGIHRGTSLVFETGGEFNYKNNTASAGIGFGSTPTNLSESFVEIAGKLTTPNNIDFTFNGNGYIAFSVGNTLNLGSNSKIKLEGMSISDYVININANAVVTLSGNEAEIKNGDLHLDPTANLILDNNAKLTLQQSNGKLEIHEGATVTVKNSSKFVVEDGANIGIHRGGKLIIESTGELDFQNQTTGAGIGFGGTPTTEAEPYVEIRGKLTVADYADLTFSGNGFFRFGFPDDGTGASNILTGPNSKITLQGSDRTDKIAEILDNTYILPNWDETTGFTIEHGTVLMGANASINAANTDFFFRNASFLKLGANKHGGIKTWSCSASAININVDGAINGLTGLATGCSGLVIRITNSTFTHCDIGLLTYENGAGLSHSHFENNGIGWQSNGSIYSRKIDAGDFKDNNMGISYLGSAGAGLLIMDGLIKRNFSYGISISQAMVTVQCGGIKENGIGVQLGIGSILNMSKDIPPYGGDVTATDNNTTIKVELASNLYLNNGFNNLMPSIEGTKSIANGLFISWSLPVNISSENNKWRNTSGSQSFRPVWGVDYQLSNFSGGFPPIKKVFLNDPSPLATVAICGQGGGIHHGGGDGIDQECPGCVSITTKDFVKEKLNKAISYALSKMSEIHHGCTTDDCNEPGNIIRDDRKAVDLFHQILTFGIEHPKPEEEFLLKLAYQKMLEALSNSFLTGQITRAENSPQFSSEVQMVIDIQNGMLQSFGTDNTTYPYKLSVSLGKAQILRMAGRHDVSLPLLDNIITWTQPDQMTIVQQWRCLVSAEYQVMTGAISPMQFEDALNSCGGVSGKSSSSDSKIAEATEQTKETLPFLKNGTDKIYIIPNPAEDELMVIFGNTNINAIRITNILGQEIYINKQAVGRLKIDVSKLQRGLYFIEAKNEQNGNRVIEKIVLD